MKREKVKCSCEKCQLRTLFFTNVTANELIDICQIKEEKSYSKGDFITREGDVVNEFLYLKEGLVKLSKSTIDGKDQIISFSKPYDFVSLLSIFSSERYKYSVSTVENSVVCILNLNLIKTNAMQNAICDLNFIGIQ